MKRVSTAALKGMLRSGGELAPLDVREAGQFGLGHPLLAVPAPYSRLELVVGALVPRRSTPVVLIDDGDDVAERAAERLAALGYADLSMLDGGVPAWAKAGYILFMGVHVPSKGFGEIVAQRRRTPVVSPAEVKAGFESGADMVVVDCRPEDEYERQHVPGAINCPGVELLQRIGDLVPSPGTLTVVTCAGRTRGIIGAQSLIDAGVQRRIAVLRDGTMGWRRAGLPLDRGPGRRHQTPSSGAVEAARQAAAALRRRFAVAGIDRATLQAWRREAGRRTTYLVDVRDPAEYRAGHLAGSVSAPGGQLIQATDAWLGTLGARVVLVDDTGVRATVTAHWLKEMGWDAYVLDGGLGVDGLETGEAPSPAIGAASVEETTPAESAAAVQAGEAAVIDVGSSMTFRARHISGAHWACRPRLDRIVGALRGTKRAVLTADDDRMARLAALDLGRLIAIPAAVLRGGTAAWVAAGLATAASPALPPDGACIDHLFWAHDRHQGNAAAIDAYLGWETGLPAQLEADGDARYLRP